MKSASDLMQTSSGRAGVIIVMWKELKWDKWDHNQSFVSSLLLRLLILEIRHQRGWDTTVSMQGKKNKITAFKRKGTISKYFSSRYFGEKNKNKNKKWYHKDSNWAAEQLLKYLYLFPVINISSLYKCIPTDMEKLNLYTEAALCSLPLQEYLCISNASSKDRWLKQFNGVVRAGQGMATPSGSAVVYTSSWT